jgi:hypothetical protein
VRQGPLSWIQREAIEMHDISIVVHFVHPRRFAVCLIPPGEKQTRP